jgi:hypothetical protein
MRRSSLRRLVAGACCAVATLAVVPGAAAAGDLTPGGVIGAAPQHVVTVFLSELRVEAYADGDLTTCGDFGFLQAQAHGGWAKVLRGAGGSGPEAASTRVQNANKPSLHLDTASQRWCDGSKYQLPLQLGKRNILQYVGTPGATDTLQLGALELDGYGAAGWVDCEAWENTTFTVPAPNGTTGDVVVFGDSCGSGNELWLTVEVTIVTSLERVG